MLVSDGWVVNLFLSCGITVSPVIQPNCLYSTHMGSNRKWLWRLALSAAASFLILGFMIRMVTSGLEGSERAHLLDALRAVAITGIGVYVVASLAQTLVRAVRFRLLIRAANEDECPSLFHTVLVTLVRNMTVDMLPSRVGELSYVALMNRGYSVSAHTCVSSLSISFLFDLIALVLILATALVPGLAGGAAFSKSLIGVLAIVIIVTGIIATMIFAGLHICCRIARNWLGASPRWRLLGKTLSFLEKLDGAIAQTRQSKITLKLLALSLGVRLIKYAGFYALFLAVTGPSFPELAGEPVWNVLYALVGAEAAGSLPIPSFMSFGTYEAGGTLALTILGYSSAISMVTIGAVHIFSQIVDYSLGGIGFLLFTFLVKRGKADDPKPKRRTSIAIAVSALALVILGAAFALLQIRKTKKLGSLAPPDKGTIVAVTDNVQADIRQKLGDAEGFVVWSSNRSGNHDIYIMMLPSLKIRPLTNHPNTEYFPRISPDGQKIVFARSRIPWVSQRDPFQWDIIMLDLATEAEQVLAEKGNAPTWSEDGKYVYFQREGSTFVRHELATGKEVNVFSPSTTKYPATLMLETPCFSETQQKMAVTMRKERRGVATWALDGSIRSYFDGCQITWAPDGSYLYYMDKGGRQHNALYRIEPDSGKRALWLDLPGEYSHEYFPKVANTGKALVLGASTGGHEHDSADYEIFFWRIGSQAENAVRLTHHTGNDCWPDVYLK